MNASDAINDLLALVERIEASARACDVDHSQPWESHMAARLAAVKEVLGDHRLLNLYAHAADDSIGPDDQPLILLGMLLAKRTLTNPPDEAGWGSV
jgi:hypothetical protein